MKTEVKIRYADETDVFLLAELGRETFHDAFVDHPQMRLSDLEAYLTDAFTIERMKSETADPQTRFLIAEIGGEPAGYAKLIGGATEEGVEATKPVKLQRLYARQKFLGQGLGAALMSRCLLESAAGGHDAVWLRVWEHNLRARNFYRQWRFEPKLPILFRFGNSMLTEILMQRAV